MAEEHGTAKGITKEDRIKQREIMKQEMAENPSSMYWLPFSGEHGYAVAKTLRNIDRDYNRMLRTSGYGTPIEKVKEVQNELRDYGKRIWDIVTEYIPKLHTIPVERSYTLNNDVSERRQKAKIRASICFLPRSTEAGYLGMAVKQIEETGVVLQGSGDLDNLNNLIHGCYDKVNHDLNDIANKLALIVPPPKNKKGSYSDRAATA